MTPHEAQHLHSQKAKELAQEATEQFQKELLEALQATKFPAEDIPACLRDIVSALMHETPQSLNCSLEVYSNIALKKPAEWNMQEFEIALACYKSKTMKQLRDTDIGVFIEHQGKIDACAKQWVELTQAIAKPIEERIEAERVRKLEAYMSDLRRQSVSDELQGNGKRIPLGTAK